MKHALTRSRFRSCKLLYLLQETNEDGKVPHGSTLTVRMATQLTKRLCHCPFETVSSVLDAEKAWVEVRRQNGLVRTRVQATCVLHSQASELPMLILDGITVAGQRAGAFSSFLKCVFILLKSSQFSCLATDKYVMAI